jgi:hypothetical protein
MALFESSLPVANAMAAKPPATTRDALTMLQAVWREIRIRSAKTIGAEAESMSRLVADEGSPDACEH